MSLCDDVIREIFEYSNQKEKLRLRQINKFAHENFKMKGLHDMFRVYGEIPSITNEILEQHDQLEYLVITKKMFFPKFEIFKKLKVLHNNEHHPNYHLSINCYVKEKEVLVDFRGIFNASFPLEEDEYLLFVRELQITLAAARRIKQLENELNKRLY